ncbi:D-alanyl-D-alanine dipeptidase [Escherichia coli]|uniref:D-alanyl-D-alanine dipeptidase n=1 Tax=Escherichia coli TaxID=562 RepID=UPI003D224BB1
MSDTTELVDLAVIFPDLEIELKYACADNITGKAIYQQARCLLHKDAITALAKSISIAQLSGLQLVIYDAYRPQQAQAMLWQACPDPQYVVDVTVGSNHSRGTAIDLTLRDYRAGEKYQHRPAVRVTTGDLRCVSPTTSTGDVVASLPRPAICC